MGNPHHGGGTVDHVAGVRAHRRSGLFGRLTWQEHAERRAASRNLRLEDEVAVHRATELAGGIQAEAAAVVGGSVGAALEASEAAGAVELGDGRFAGADRPAE